VIRAVRSASATAIAFAASFAVLRFEPHTTMPPSNAATAAAIAPRSNRITPKNIAKRTTPPPHVAIRETRMNLAAALDLSSKLFDERLKADNLIVGIAVSFVIRIVVDVLHAAQLITATYECLSGHRYTPSTPRRVTLSSIYLSANNRNSLLIDRSRIPCLEGSEIDFARLVSRSRATHEP
jgi:hypothetical protein